MCYRWQQGVVFRDQEGIQGQGIDSAVSMAQDGECGKLPS